MPAMTIAAIAYLAFNATFAALVLFLADLWLPHTVDRSIWPALPPALAVAIDIALLAAFGLQHSLMARERCKTLMVRHVPPYLSRSVYVLVSSVTLALVIAFWQPLPAVVWQVESVPAAALLWAIFAGGWLLVVAATYMINHFELFGLAQAWRHWRGKAVPQEHFRTPYLYRYVRHPLYLGFLLAFWATPQMTAGHLLFAAGMSAYILVGLSLEERDLIRHFGQAYRDYRQRVPALLPGLKPH